VGDEDIQVTANVKFVQQQSWHQAQHLLPVLSLCVLVGSEIVS
jgi:hypothetical protein